MHHALNMGDRNIGVLQQTLDDLCNVVGTLEYTMHYMSQNDTDQSIMDSLTIDPRNEFIFSFRLWQQSCMECGS